MSILGLILTLTSLSSRFPAWSKTSAQKYKYFKNEKIIQDEKKAFHIIFEGFSMKQIKPPFLEGSNCTLGMA